MWTEEKKECLMSLLRNINANDVIKTVCCKHTNRTKHPVKTYHCLS